MPKKKYLILQSNSMSIYTLSDISAMDNIVICHRKNAFKNRLLNLLFNIHNSGHIRKYINLPFKSIWDGLLFGKLLKQFEPDYILFTTSWYSDHLLTYFRNNARNSVILFRFTDLVVRGLGNSCDSTVRKVEKQFDGVLVYSKEDAERYGFTYHSVGYSPIKIEMLKPCKKYDVVFIGAEKGRIDKIRQAYNKFVAAGLSCFFYVILVKEDKRKNDGIIYADKVMPFDEYLSYEVSAKCLFELVQDGSSGRTYRMMEAIIYNKLLITNCQEIKLTDYYYPEYVQLYDDVLEIDPSFISNGLDKIDYQYKGDFSPKRVLEFIEKKW